MSFITSASHEKSEKSELIQDIEFAERTIQAKRQERLAAQQSHQSFKDELDVLQMDSVASASSLQKTNTERSIAEQELWQKMQQLNAFNQRCDAIKQQLNSERQTTVSCEKATQEVEILLKERAKEFKKVDSYAQSLKDNVIRDALKLVNFRKTENELISEIRCAQVRNCYYSVED